MELIQINSTNHFQIDLFHQFIAEIFPGVSFREWHKKGFWTKDYTAYSIVENNRIISNVCCMKMKIFIDGEIYNAVQIGAVGTIPEYGNKGLSKKLMNYLIEKLRDTTDLFFLYANNRVFEFYKKFNFEPVKEKVFYADGIQNKSNPIFRKLNIDDKNDFLILNDLLKKNKPITKIFGAADYHYVAMWHFFNTHKNDLFYFEDQNIISIQRQIENTLHIYEVIFSKEFNINDVITTNEADELKIYFPPDQINYDIKKVDSEVTGLFVLGNIFTCNQTFRFPPTAIT